MHPDLSPAGSQVSTETIRKRQNGKPFIFHLVGHSNTGKTALISSWIPLLSAKGYKAGVIKSCHNEIQKKDTEKDSDVYRKAGSEATGLISSGYTEIQVMRTLTLPEMIENYFADCHVVFIEGFKQESVTKKILCLRKGVSEEIFIPDDQLMAIIGDFEIPARAPYIKFNDTISQLLFLENSMKAETDTTLNVSVNGKEIPLNDFVHSIFSNVIQSMIASLKIEDREISSIRIELHKK